MAQPIGLCFHKKWIEGVPVSDGNRKCPRSSGHCLLGQRGWSWGGRSNPVTFLEALSRGRTERSPRFGGMQGGVVSLTLM